LDELMRRSAVALDHRFKLQRSRLEGRRDRLESLNPIAVLRRGFAVVSHPDGRVVRSVQQVKPGDPLDVQVSNGSFDVQVRRDHRGEA
jgi:exodeoxyribonuclease VII large subunit